MSELQQEYDKYPRLYARYGDPTEELHRPDGPYDKWLRDMSTREDAQFEPVEFDPNLHRGQLVYVPKLEAKDQFPNLPDWLYYTGVNVKLARSLGARAFFRLSHQLRHQPVSLDDSRPLIDRLVADQLEGKNTMVVSSHFTFTEMGNIKALCFGAKEDRPRISQGGLVMNKLMASQTYKGKDIVDHFTPIGNVYFSYPISASSEKHGVPMSATNLGNALFKTVLRADLAKGGLELDVALTGKQVVRVNDENNELDHYEIPEIISSSAKLVKDFDNLVAITLIDSPVTGRQEMDIGEVYDIQELRKANSPEEIVDFVYGGEIVRSIRERTGKEVDYHKSRYAL